VTIRRREAKSGTPRGLALRRARGVGSRGYNGPSRNRLFTVSMAVKRCLRRELARWGASPQPEEMRRKLCTGGCGWLLE